MVGVGRGGKGWLRVDGGLKKRLGDASELGVGWGVNAGRHPGQRLLGRVRGEGQGAL